MTYNDVYETYQALVNLSYSAVNEARARNIPWAKADEAMVDVRNFKALAKADGWNTYHNYTGIVVERIR